ncbi:MAG: hypothetical protein DCC55_11510 [Chloroflexi bacterium]|nr:MAG: hypothetical protein DCC55_11510 [Chloroflexota bacterium]
MKILPPVRRWFVMALLGAGLFCLLLALNMQRGRNHDEHQFIAAGKLMAAGLQPYADFPYFHVPTLGIVYAALFSRFPPLLLTARLFSILCSWLSLLILFAVAYRSLGPPLRWTAASSIVVLLIAAPLFTHTSGRAWNHDLPVLLLLLAYLVYGQAEPGMKSYMRRPALVGAGLLIGLAAGVRLSFALLAPAFLLAQGVSYLRWYGAGSNPQKQLVEWMMDSGLFGLGCLLGFGPALWYAWQTPEPFWFGNVEYIRLNTLYYRNLAQPPEAMTLASKLLYFVRLIVLQPGNLLLLAAAVALPWRTPAATGLLAKEHSRLWLLFFLAGFAFVAALGATPSQWQYFYPLMPLAALAASYGLAAQPADVQRQRTRWLLAAALLAALLALPRYTSGLIRLWPPDEWSTWQAHMRSAEIATLVDGGRVLTLAPLYPLESDMPIEPALATGPFAWRVADQVAAERRRRLGLLGPGDLPDYWAANPPRAVLVGAAEDDAAEEAPLIDQARTHGYVPVELADKATLWLSPLAEWGSTIRLGGHTLPQHTLEPGASFVATFYLQAMRSMATNLNVLVRVVGRDAEELARSEGWPWGAPTSTWTPGEVWPDGHELTLPPTTAPGVYRVEVGFYDPATLGLLDDATTVGYLFVGADEAAPIPAAPLAEFGDGLQLLAAAVTPGTTDSIAPGKAVTIRLIWQASARPAADYTVFVHLVGPDGALVAQHDAPPLGGFYPTRFWRPGHPVTDEVAVMLPEHAPPGPHRILVGLYDSATLQRLPVVHAGQPVGDVFELGIIHVSR